MGFLELTGQRYYRLVPPKKFDQIISICIENISLDVKKALSDPIKIIDFI